MSTTIRQNERSSAIDLISTINGFVSNKDLKIKKAGGECTISLDRHNRMFPDVILYGDLKNSEILQGWELKMPDVEITDSVFIADAQRKADALNLNSCVIWNFTYAVLYIKNNEGTFEKIKTWSTLSIKNREDVSKHRAEWIETLKSIILEINDYFVLGKLERASIMKVVSNYSISMIIERNKLLVADELNAMSKSDAILRAFISDWWNTSKLEFNYDENNEFLAYAKVIILSWANKIMFAHMIKREQNTAYLINNIGVDTSIKETKEIFKKITEKCDFFNIFSELKYDEYIPNNSWKDFLELSLFFKENITSIDQKVLQDILENTVSLGKRELNGQYTTPIELAKILVEITINDLNEPVIDCCCGTGTISKAALELKRKNLCNTKQAVETVWASDKNEYPLQIANISMTDSETINIANRIFKHNALDLKVGEIVSIVNPADGQKMNLKLPEFGAAISNLPFVPFENISEDEKFLIDKMNVKLDGRSDLCYYIVIKIADVLKTGGKLGIITSNAWLGTKAGEMFFNEIKNHYNIKQIHISGKGRWFKNADIVTTIMILEKKSKKSNDDNSKIAFWLWKKTLDEISDNCKMRCDLINSAILQEEKNKEVSKLSEYSICKIDELKKMNVSYNALFHNIEWLTDLKENIIRIGEVFKVFRGSRRGWDDLFYPKAGTHSIESKYLKKVLKNARSVTHLDAVADDDAFCCGETMEQLKKNNDVGALSWINRFSNQKNNKGKDLTTVLQKSNMEWYELKANEVAEIFTTMNPDKRLYFAKFKQPSFINQRLIGLNSSSEYTDTDLNHALLNSIFTMFYIEASGFGRGLGALDISKTSLENCYMLNPAKIKKEQRDKIVNAFNSLKKRPIKNVYEELNDSSRIAFEKEVMESYGISGYYDKIKESLISMMNTRYTVKDNE